MSATMVAVDLGAQSGRVAVGRFDGERLDVEEVRRFPNEPVLVDRLLQWDVLGLYREVVAGLRAAQAHAGRVDSIGVDSWAIDFGLLDRQGRLVRNPVHYRDARRAAAYEPALARNTPPEQ
jgi:sugar (pentulose or hexulose) kinase